MTNKRTVRRSPKRRKRASAKASGQKQGSKSKTIPKRRTKLTAAQRQQQEKARLKGLHVIRLMRQGDSLTKASKKAKTTPPTVKKHGHAGLRKVAGHWVAIPVD